MNIRWVKTPLNTQIIDTALSQCGDWLRFDAWCWLLGSEYQPQPITDHLRKSLAVEDSVLVMRVDPSDYGGFAAPWVWEWINKYREPNVSTALENSLSASNLLAGKAPTGLGGLSALSNPFRRT